MEEVQMDKKEYLERLSKNILRYRAIAGLNQAQLAEMAGLTRQGFINIEKGKAEPKTSNLQKIADALEVNIFELFKEQPKFASLRFRSKKTMTSRDRSLREQTLLEFKIWLDHYKFLEKQLNDHAKFKLAKLVGVPKLTPAMMAEKAREVLGLQTREVVADMCGLKESAGIKVWHAKPNSQAFFGFSLAEKDGGPAIGVNVSEGINVERKIFTVAHELGHILLHPASYCAVDELEPKEEEKEADIFAGYFLMPESAFLSEWSKNSGFSFVDRVLRVKRYFRVSYMAVLIRLSEQGCDTYQNLFIKFAAGYQKDYKHDLKKHFEPDSVNSGFRREPESALSNLDFMEERFKKLVRQAFEQELITTSKAAEMLGISLAKMRELGVSWRENP